MTVTASNFERREFDLYETERWATEALLRRFPVRGLAVWEPAAGRHAIADVLAEQGARVTTTDITTYDRSHDKVLDFFKCAEDPWWAPSSCDDIDAIVTNPPYGKGNREAVRFAELALKRCDGMVALLLTAKFDFGKTRAHLFRDNPRFAAKIALVDRISWAGNGETGTEDHAWFIWQARRETEHPVMLWEGK